MGDGKRQLVEIIAALRSDLEAAIAEGVGKSVKFDLDEIEVELHTQITKTGDLKINGGVEFKILGFELGSAGVEGTGSYSKENAHTIRLKLKPKLQTANGTVTGVVMSDLD
jgi:hypothetical protein